jgi:hypothetical protein
MFHYHSIDLFRMFYNNFEQQLENISIEKQQHNLNKFLKLFFFSLLER